MKFSDKTRMREWWSLELKRPQRSATPAPLFYKWINWAPWNQRFLKGHKTRLFESQGPVGLLAQDLFTVLHWYTSLVAQMIKKFACNAGDLVWIPEMGRSLEKGIATHSSILAWRIPWKKRQAGYCPWSHKELDMTDWLTHTYTHTHTHTVIHQLFSVSFLILFPHSLLQSTEYGSMCSLSLSVCVYIYIHTQIYLDPSMLLQMEWFHSFFMDE